MYYYFLIFEENWSLKIIISSVMHIMKSVHWSYWELTYTKMNISVFCYDKFKLKKEMFY